ncbi:MAG TPA: DUF4129 domain-containing protein [Gemmataceae bacterium]|jgi:hypothetical protein
MSSDKQNQTLADYVALAISPALIMGLVASLVFFLLNVLYAGDYVDRMRWILFFFVFGAVLIARMTMLDDTSSRAALYGVPLGFLTWLGMQMFVEYPEDGGAKELSFLINGGLIGLVWWCAHRLTWDCTNIDEQTDVNAEGLLQAAGLDEQTDIPTQIAETKEGESWLQRWRRYREERNKKRTLGVWVVYFSLAALPLFGLGQAIIPAEDVQRRESSFWLMVVYVACGLSLLLTTCFLSLRRYLRQRRLQMPGAMTGVWLTVGGMLIGGLLLLGAMLPRPNAEYSLFSLTAAKSPERGASKFAMKGGRPGKGEGRPGADDPEGKKNDADSGGEKGQQKGERGAATKQGQKGSGGKDGKSSQSGDRQGKNDGQSQKTQNNGSNQSKGDPGSGRDQPADKNKGERARGESDKRDASDKSDQRSDKDSSQRSDSSSSSKMSPSAVRDMVSKIAPVLKWIVFALIALGVLFFVLRSGLQFLANFTAWARRLLDAFRNFWANLFGAGKKTADEEECVEQEEQRLRERPFASFSNPFAGGRTGMAMPELIRYTFAAAQAWARERDLGRQPGETPLEFAQRIGTEVPALEADLHRLALLYARAVYARGGLPGDSMALLRQFWQRLEAVAEQPLSA